MRFQVPQFIEVEDKIFGPLTFRQFIYLAGGAGLSFILWTLLPTLIAIPAILAGGGLAAAFAFYKYNGRPFVFFVQSWLSYTLGNKLYLWRKESKKVTSSAGPAPSGAGGERLVVPKLSQGKLKDIAWSLDVQNPAQNQNE